MSKHLFTLRLKAGRAKPLLAGHPWVFADALAKTKGPQAPPGAEVRVEDPAGECVGRGYYSPHSAIAVRLLTRKDEPAGEKLLAKRIARAAALRREVLGLGTDPSAPGATSAYRLIHSEGDGLGGLIADRYGECLCVQFGTVGMDQRREMILDLLEAQLHPKAILDKSDARMRKLERLPPVVKRLVRGTEPGAPAAVREEGIRLRVDLEGGQKTGLYLDQRENRRRFASFAKGRDVLDVFAYTGGFSLHAARAGAKSLTLIESSAGALRSAKANLEENGVRDADLIHGDWAGSFRHLREKKRRFDLAVLDPPKFARGKQDVPRALNGYRNLNGQAARLLRPGGLLFTCSCSGNVPEVEFERTVARGLAQAGRRGALLERRGAAPDHPVPPGFGQGSYLKCLVLRVE